MLSNKQIQDLITQKLKPNKSFEKFCNERGIEYNTASFSHKKSFKWKKIIIPASAVAAVALCVGLPFAFKPDNSNGIILYGDSDVASEIIQQESLEKNAVLFDLNKSESFSNIIRIYPPTKAEFTLGYLVEEVIYGFDYDNEFYAYEFNYLARAYKGYEFSDYKLYVDSVNSIYHNEIKFNYVIRDNNRERIAYVSFVKNGFDYYVNLHGYEDVTDIDDNSVEIFIRNTF